VLYCGHILSELEHSLMNESIWLISPPASGKTTILLDIFAQLPEEQWIFLSPLRALAEEFYLRAKSVIPSVVYWCNQQEEIPLKGLIIVTPEQVDDKLLSRYSRANIIVDEIHLWEHWGKSFRPIMWESYFRLVEKSPLTIHLTATVDKDVKEFMELSVCHFSKTTVLDFGNNQAKYEPDRIIYYPAYLKKNIKPTIERKIIKNKSGAVLVFCAFRDEVALWGQWCEKHNISYLSCIGGEARDFQQRLVANSSPQVIIATTVLGHGVNLPDITKVFFTYKVDNHSFWLQMLTRGGRRGQSYEILTLDSNFIKPSRRLPAFFAMLKEEIITRFSIHFSIEGPWSLKESLQVKSPIKSAI